MKYKPRVLFIDDKLSDLAPILDALRDDYRIYMADNGDKGVIIARDVRPEVVVLDYLMPQKDGPKICQELRKNPRTKDLGIMMFSVSDDKSHVRDGLKCADDFVVKSVIEIDDLKAKINAAMRKFRPFITQGEKEFRLSIGCQTGHPVSVRDNGRPIDGDSEPLDISEGLHGQVAFMPPQVLRQFAPMMTSIEPAEWHVVIKQSGLDQFQKLFRKHSYLLSAYERMRAEAHRDSRLHLRIECSRGALRTPFEFMFDGKPTGDGQFLVMRHPFARTVVQHANSRSVLSPEILNTYSEQERDLRILLIGSNTEPAIPGVDDEIDQLQQNVETWFEEQGVRADVTTLATASASYRNVYDTLRGNNFDIVHYAGHGSHDRSDPEKSALYFWEHENRRGKIVPLTCHTLHGLLEPSETTLVYLSCCLSAASAPGGRMLHDDYLGVCDSLVLASIPSVLAHRWPVSDAGSVALALEFYRTLAQTGQIDRALHQARGTVRNRIPEDSAWVSPILVMQD
jgi:DNA-binding response OmpR family regulator